MLDVVATLQSLESLLRSVAGDVDLRLELAETTGEACVDRAELERIVVDMVTVARTKSPAGSRLTITSCATALDTVDAARLGALPAGSYVVVTVALEGGDELGVARFRIDLPREHGTLAAARGRRRTRRARASGTILLVEDEADVRTLTKRLLQREGFTVACAADGIAALAWARAHSGSIDVLLTDVMMPHMGGRVLADTLLRERPGVSIVFMSGYGEDFILEDEDGAGLGSAAARVTFLLKPVRQDVLVDTVTSAVDKARSPGPAAGSNSSNSRNSSDG